MLATCFRSFSVHKIYPENILKCRLWPHLLLRVLKHVGVLRTLMQVALGSNREILHQTVSLAAQLTFCLHAGVTSVCFPDVTPYFRLLRRTTIIPQTYLSVIPLCFLSPSAGSAPCSVQSCDFSRCRPKLVSPRKPSLLSLGIRLRATGQMRKYSRA